MCLPIQKWIIPWLQEKNKSRVAPDVVANCVPKLVNIQLWATFYKQTLLLLSMGHRPFLEWWKAGGSTWVKTSPEMLPTLQRTCSNSTHLSYDLSVVRQRKVLFHVSGEEKKTAFANHSIMESDVTLRGLKLSKSSLSGTQRAAIATRRDVIPLNCRISGLIIQQRCKSRNMCLCTNFYLHEPHAFQL